MKTNELMSIFVAYRLDLFLATTKLNIAFNETEIIMIIVLFLSFFTRIHLSTEANGECISSKLTVLKFKLHLMPC